MLLIDSPASVDGSYEVATAQFGPALSQAGDQRRAGRGQRRHRSAARRLPAVHQRRRGRAASIALVDRGNCNFVVKVKNAQNAGAVGVVVVNNVAGPPMAPWAAPTRRSRFRSVMIRQDDGARLFQTIAGSPQPTPTPPAPPPPNNPGPTPTKPPTPPPPNSEPGRSTPSSTSEAPSTCVENGTTLCLENDRFRVRARWTTRAGATGNGNAARLTGDSGYLLVLRAGERGARAQGKNACALAFNHFWFFAAGLTDVDVVIEVADTKSGRVLTYHNPQGRPFPRGAGHRRVPDLSVN